MIHTSVGLTLWDFPVKYTRTQAKVSIQPNSKEFRSKYQIRSVTKTFTILTQDIRISRDKDLITLGSHMTKVSRD